MHWSHAKGKKDPADRLDRIIYNRTSGLVPFFSSCLSCILTISQIMTEKHNYEEGCSTFSMTRLNVTALWEVNSTRLECKILQMSSRWQMKACEYMHLILSQANLLEICFLLLQVCIGINFLQVFIKS